MGDRATGRKVGDVAPSIVGPVALAVAAVVAGRIGAVAVATAFAIGAVVALHATFLSLRWRRLVARVEGTVRRVVGTVLAFAVLLPVHLLVMTPIGLMLRATGRGPLRDRRSDTSYWVKRGSPAAGDSLRLFTDERHWVRPGGPAAPRSTIARTVAVTLVVELLVAGGVILWRDRADEASQPGLRSLELPGTLGSAALRDLPWAPAANQEMADVTSGLVYTPYVGSSLRDHSGRYVNVHDRVRRSYEPSVPGAEPLDVWFFGGSTMFGFDLQRDDHTIASELVRLAERDGISIRARNYGSPGFVNYQETMELTQLVTAGERPDLVVFYDGINDRTLALLKVLGLEDPLGDPSDLEAYQMRPLMATLVPGGSARGPAPLVDVGDRPTMSADRVVTGVTSVYGRGVDLSRILSREYGFEVTHFWQPDIYSKQPLDPGERDLLPSLGIDDRSLATMAALSRRVAAALPEGVEDISDALDDVDGPVLADMVHINEVGARAVAAAMYRHLHDDLVRLSEPSSAGG